MRRTKKIKLVKMRRAKRSRARTRGTAACPRLSIFRSNQALYAQLIDDAAGVTLLSSSSKSTVEQALKMGKQLAEKAQGMGIKAAVFDRGRYQYHGRVKAVAEGAREGGLKI